MNNDVMTALLIKNMLAGETMAEAEINLLAASLRIPPTGHCGNIYFRPNLLMQGEIINGHKHNFDHVFLVPFGLARVEAITPDGRTLDRTFGPSSPFGIWALIKKNVEHKLTGMCPVNFSLCTYSIRTPDGEVTEERTGWEPAFG